MIDGQPLTHGTVRFIPSNNRASSGQVDREGRFVLSCFAQADGAVVGQHDVTVTASEPLNDTQIRWNAPKKYSDPFSSGLTQVVDGPTDSVVINLTWDGGKPFVEGGSPRRKTEGDGDPPRMRGKSSTQ